jgi:hypothetical protein
MKLNNNKPLNAHIAGTQYKVATVKGSEWEEAESFIKKATRLYLSPSTWAAHIKRKKKRNYDLQNAGKEVNSNPSNHNHPLAYV